VDPHFFSPVYKSSQNADKLSEGAARRFSASRRLDFPFSRAYLGGVQAKNPGGACETMRPGWQFLSWRWWLVHFLGFALVYVAGRLTAAFLKG
jgi:hypothetical protein